MASDKKLSAAGSNLLLPNSTADRRIRHRDGVDAGPLGFQWWGKALGVMSVGMTRSLAGSGMFILNAGHIGHEQENKDDGERGHEISTPLVTTAEPSRESCAKIDFIPFVASVPFPDYDRYSPDVQVLSLQLYCS